jgi:hypothetical protein
VLIICWDQVEALLSLAAGTCRVLAASALQRGEVGLCLLAGKGSVAGSSVAVERLPSLSGAIAMVHEGKTVRGLLIETNTLIIKKKWTS